MPRLRVPFLLAPLAAGSAAIATQATQATQGGSPDAMKDTMTKLENELAAKYGEAERPRFQRGIEQAARFWRKEDGGDAAFGGVGRQFMAPDSVVRNALFSRMEFSLESLDGHMNEIARDFRRQADLDLGEIYPFDEVLGGYDPSAHFVAHSFPNPLAFAILLNFPITTLEQRLAGGKRLE